MRPLCFKDIEVLQLHVKIKHGKRKNGSKHVEKKLVFALQNLDTSLVTHCREA